jgi:hypothetical protein
MENLSFPIGKFQYQAPTSASQRQQRIEEVAAAPQQVRAAVADLSQEQLNTPYRPAGWTVRQVVHHLADSHMNAYIRFKLALTEDAPQVKPYDEKLWAETAENTTTPVQVSLSLLDSLHQRWVYLLKGMDEQGFRRHLAPSRTRNRGSGPLLGALRLAWPPPCRAHQVAARAYALVIAKHFRPERTLRKNVSQGCSRALLHFFPEKLGTCGGPARNPCPSSPTFFLRTSCTAPTSS